MRKTATPIAHIHHWVYQTVCSGARIDVDVDIEPTFALLSLSPALISAPSLLLRQDAIKPVNGRKNECKGLESQDGQQ